MAGRASPRYVAARERLLTTVWHVEDLLPQGRGDWESSNAYAGPTCGESLAD